MKVITIGMSVHELLRAGEEINIQTEIMNHDERGCIVKSEIGMSYVDLKFDKDVEERFARFKATLCHPPHCLPVIKSEDQSVNFYLGRCIKVPPIEVPVHPGTVIGVVVRNSCERAIVVQVLENGLEIQRLYNS